MELVEAAVVVMVSTEGCPVVPAMVTLDGLKEKVGK